MSIKNIIYDAVTNSLKLLSRRSDQPSVVIPLTPGQLMPVGSIIQSIMTEAEFQAEAGTSWILMDGRSIVGSKLARIKSISVIPNASGRFLRTAGSAGAGLVAAALAVQQPDSTAQKGLGGTATLGFTAVIAYGSATVDSSAHTHEITDANGTHYGAIGGIGPPASGPYGVIVADGYSALWAKAASAGGHTHQVSTSHNMAHDHTLSVTSTDTETRPVNLTVNTFIKIN